jgi:hypothetical protein
MNVNVTWETVFIVLVLPVTTAFGVVIKITWDRFSQYKLQRKELIYNKRLFNVENKLKNFYLPMFLCLKKDKYMWDLVKQLLGKDHHNDDDIMQAYKEVLMCEQGHSMLKKLDSLMLENHLRALEIINDHAVSSEPSDYMVHMLSEYSKHVMVYKFLRDDHSVDFPKHYGAPYPVRLLDAIEAQTLRFQQEYNTLTKSGLPKRKKEQQCIVKCKSCSKCVNYSCNIHNVKCNCA